MPAFYPPTLPRHLPLTPPEYMPYSNDSYGGQFYGLGNDSRYEVEAYEKSMYGKQPGRDAYDYSQQAPAYQARQPNVFGTIGAPILPPIRVPDNMDLSQVHQSIEASQPAQEQLKEEKVAGGVAAHLDYEMEHMVDFVAEMAQGIVQPNASVAPAFRKYVSQILTSTRLPSSTIVLALHYLSTRMTMLSSQGVYTSSSGHLYHMLTTALMLASKFLDDNTFQNRSWSEVSHISVADLNSHELEWLKDIMWDLHFDSQDPRGFKGWIEKWRVWAAKKKVAMSVSASKLTSIDTSMAIQHPAPKYMPQTPLYTPTYNEAMYSARERTPPHVWGQWSQTRTLSPPSANHSSPTTPNWYDQSGMGYSQTASVWHGQLPRLPLPSTNNSPYYPSYGQQYGSRWGHGSNCGCRYCLMHHERYNMGQSYGMQAVVG